MGRLFFLILLLYSWSAPENSEPKFSSVLFITYVDTFNYEYKQIVTLKRKIEIIDSKQYRLFIVPVIRNNSELFPDSLGKARIASGKKNVTDTIYSIFIYSKADKLMARYPFDNLNKAKGKIQDDKRILQMFTVDEKTRKTFERNLGKPFEVIKTDSVRIEKFTLNKIKQDDPDSVYYYYRHIDFGAGFSFSKTLDAKYNKKVFKILYITNPIKEENLDVPKRESFFEFKTNKVTNINLLNAVIDKFEKDKESGFK